MSEKTPDAYEQAYVPHTPEMLNPRSVTVRAVSLVVLGILIATLGLMFFQILSAFLLPMFLAGILTIICQPVYSYFLRRTGQKRYWAAGITTSVLVSLILIPTIVGILMGSLQLYSLAKFHLDPDNWSRTMEEVSERLNVRKAAEWWQMTFPGTNFKRLIEKGNESEDDNDPNQESSETSETSEHNLTVAKEVEPPVATAMSADSPEEIGIAAGQMSDLGVSETPAPQLPEDDGRERREANRDLLPVEIEIEKREEEIRSGLQGFFLGLIQTTLTPGTALSTFNILASLSWSAMGVVIFIISIYYFLADGPKLLKASEEMIPVNTEHQKRLYQQFAIAVRAVMTSTMLAALGQGIATSVMLWFLGFGHFFLYTIVCILAALVPLGGIWLVWFPCMLVLFWQGFYLWGSVLFLYGFFVVGTIDNVLRAYVLNSDAKLHPLLALVTILGGLQVMGLWGVFIAPIVASVLHALVVIFNQELADLTKDRNLLRESSPMIPAMSSSSAVADMKV